MSGTKNYLSATWGKGFIREHSVGQVSYYATFHPEFDLIEGNLEHADRYLIVALHPEAGTITFHMYPSPDGKGFIVETPDKPEVKIFLDKHREFVHWCSEQIEEHAAE
jgi:hypothetical protein